jgi:DNA-binding transcriptional regulator YiaG
MNKEELMVWLERHQLSRSQLGVCLGISRALVSAWTLGTREIPGWLPYALGERNLKKAIKKHK